MPSSPTHPPECDCQAYACQLRAKGMQVSPAATPSQHNRKAPARPRYNSWEKGIAGEHRANGTFMPFLDKQGDVVPIKKYSEQRHRIDDAVTRTRESLTRASTS